MQNKTSFQQPSPNADGLYGVQTWSAGPIFPAIIAVRETYERFMSSTIAPASIHPDDYYRQQERFYSVLSLEDRLLARTYRLTLDGVTDTYATREDAEQAAGFLLNNPTSREARRAEGGEA